MNDLILTFVGTAHEQFYDDTLRDLEGAEGPHTRPMVYLLAASDILRAHFWEVYDNRAHGIKPLPRGVPGNRRPGPRPWSRS